MHISGERGIPKPFSNAFQFGLVASILHRDHALSNRAVV